MRLYHGSTQIIKTPSLEKAKPNNDYGKGFYCTENIELAKEWACQKNCDGFASEYELSVENLSILDLTSPKYDILHWLTILINNRTFSLTPIAKDAKNYLDKNYSIDYGNFDIIKGYRANDSYFTFASNFLNNEISLAQLAQAMKLGELGIQIALKSEKAFSAISFKTSHEAKKYVYYKEFQKRDSNARKLYQDFRSHADLNGIYMIDILRGK